ncbi:trophoblast glycoprotein-like [Megalops cyprinoides]|uniref:trophoblast glycoprotein-like n=1 Tax=Megalops cyprinoides TaxID=118141 RepID=UPI001863CDFE|nr:trophoblast glycoprotein-like [Megalops cyprinoides]
MEKRNTWVHCCGNSLTLHSLKQRCFSWAQVMCVLFSLAKAENCPVSCTCIENTFTVTCRNLNMTAVPTDLPEWIRSLLVSGNNIPTLITGAFLTNGTEVGLSTILMPDNNIQTVEARAFVGLPLLQKLDLSKNRLVSISPHAFYGLYELTDLFLNDTLNSDGSQLSDALTNESLRNLQRLHLSGNKLKDIPITNFNSLNLTAIILTNNSFHTIGNDYVSRLSEHKTMQVYLALNPFKCNCELGNLYRWLEDSSQCPDAAHLLCSEPESKRGLPVLKLKKEEVDCTNADLETVSYVFLGIVLALIGVIFLMVLYLNRKGIKRWLNNIREACRDQMEVYHYRYEQDSDPRLANVAV